ncbi:MAG TPA: ATP-binding protein [Planctomycetota bacterium]|nr:ATP-binding protein [Planctomycetota bacterium]
MSKKKDNKKNRKLALPGRAAAFASHDALLEGARRMLEARAARVGAEGDEDAPAGQIRSARTADEAWRRWWQRSLDATPDTVGFAAACRRAGLDELEREALAALVLGRLSLVKGEVGKLAELADLLGVPAGEKLAAMRRCLDGGRLQVGGLIHCLNPDAELPDRRIVPAPALVEEPLASGRAALPWPVRGEAELHQYLLPLTFALRAKGEAFDDERRGLGDPEDSLRSARRADRQVARLEATLAAHPEWRLSALFAADGPALGRLERLVLLALVGRELGHLPEDDRLFTGAGLALAAGQTSAEMAASLAALAADGRLAEAGLVEEGAGQKLPGAGNVVAIEKTAYRLGAVARRALGLEDARIRRGSSDFVVREPAVRMDALVLDERVERTLGMALAQARGGAQVFKDWGIEAVLPYGRNVTLLFAGPPGVGKTACAEALAHELGRPILVADYARLQSCWIGETDKHIVAIFREARQSGAVLFWDEADSMFFDRENAFHAWEVRTVNVLLQEIERFDGVCVLTTNRRVALDPALERRITLKVEFSAPDRTMRRRIWEKMLGARLPLSGDVDAGWLSQAELTGGQIKNVLLNAARLALAERSAGPVTRADFEAAMAMELEAPDEDPRGRIGF